MTSYSGRRGCFHCGELNHIQRNCPGLKTEAVGRSGRVSNLAARGTSAERTNIDDSPTPQPKEVKDCTQDEQSLQQLQQLLATMRVNVERSKLEQSSVGTVVADTVDAVGPVVFLDVEIEGCPVRAVVDTGSQSTTVLRDQLHQIARAMRQSEHKGPTLVTPSAKLYGGSGSDRSELTITAEAQMEISLDGHHVCVPVFIQPGSDIPCLLGMNALPGLGVKFLRRNGVPLMYGTDGSHCLTDVSAEIPTSSPAPAATGGASKDQPSTATPRDLSGEPIVEARVCIIRSTYVPPRTSRIVEVQLQSPLGGDFLFEPSSPKGFDELEISEAVITPSDLKKALTPVENHASLSIRLDPGVCIGIATLVPNLPENELSSAYGCEPSSPIFGAYLILSSLHARVCQDCVTLTCSLEERCHIRLDTGVCRRIQLSEGSMHRC